MTLAAAACDDSVVGPRSRLAEGGRTLLYLLSAIPLGAAGAALLLAGWIAVPLLALTPLVLPALLAFRGGVGGVARLEGAVANALLDTRTAPRVWPTGQRGYWRRAWSVVADAAFWKQQAFLLVRFVVGGALAVAEASLLGASLAYLTLPVWYRWGGMNYGSWHVDTVGRAFLFVPAGAAGLAVGLLLLRPLAAASRSLAVGLLGGDGRPYAAVESPAVAARRRRALEVHAVSYAALNALLVVIWAVTTPGGYFWPEWTLVPLGVVLAVHAWTVVVSRAGFPLPRGLALHGGAALGLAVLLVAIWAVTTRSYFWPMWPLFVLALGFAVHLAVDRRYLRQAARIRQLETTRAGAVVQQDADLRRIERDLHDGAQAQLVALGMSIGLAEQKLANDPAAAQELLAEARRGAREALEELRTLARGFHPPVLADRGLEAAVAALADRSPVPVEVAVDLGGRPPAAVETAAYYVVAEALANVGKHANAAGAAIALRRHGDALVVEIRDDGAGGADAEGGGLRGLARRVEALDGTLTVASPPGGPTVVRVVIPCGS